MVILYCQMGNSGSVPLWSLLEQILCDWEDSRYDPMSKKEVVFYYDSVYIGEGNSHPLQYSCLENPTDRSLVGYSPWGLKESNTTE